MSFISWAVAGVGSRSERAQRLAEEAGAVLVLQDPPNRGERVLNVANAWEAALERETRWVGVLEDDTILCQDFAFRADLRAKEAARKKRFIVTYYSSRKLEDRDEGKRWRNKPHKQFVGSLCVAMDRNYAVYLVKFLRRNFHPEWPIDTAIRAFMVKHSLPMIECLPNLVDHDLDEKSTLGHPSKCGGVPVCSKSFHPRAK